MSKMHFLLGLITADSFTGPYSWPLNRYKICICLISCKPVTTVNLVFITNFSLNSVGDFAIINASRTAVMLVWWTQTPDQLFETTSQALLNAVDRDALSGWGAVVHVM